jgi:hypothetical protein
MIGVRLGIFPSIHIDFDFEVLRFLKKMVLICENSWFHKFIKFIQFSV